jgi:hypothetical protein
MVDKNTQNIDTDNFFVKLHTGINNFYPSTVKSPSYPESFKTTQLNAITIEIQVINWLPRMKTR